MILPMFFAMACMIGLSRYTAERRDIRWGLTAEIDSYMTAMVEFLRSKTLPILRQDADVEKGTRAFLAALDRLAMTSGHRLRTVILFDASGQKPLVTWINHRVVQRTGADAEALTDAWDTSSGTDTDAATTHCMAQLQKRAMARGAVLDIGSRQTVMSACAAIEAVAAAPASRAAQNSQFARLGVVWLTLDATELHAQASQIRHEIALQTILILLLGLVVVGLISAVIAQPLKSLSRFVAGEARAMRAAGDSFLSIREFSDLENMFETMKNVLDESETRLNRALLQGAQFRSRTDLARVYVEDYWQPIHGVYGPAEVAGGLLGMYFTGSFFGVVADAVGLYALTGQMQSQDTLDPVVMASGAWTFLKEALQQLAPDQAFEHATEVFDFAALTCVRYEFGHDTCTLWSMAAPERAPSRVALRQHQSPFCRGDSLMIHTYTGTVAGQIEIYFRRFQKLPPAEFLHELAVFLGADCAGAVLVMQHRALSA